LPAGSTITVGSALPELLGSVDVVGPGVGQLTISGGESSSIFRVGPGASASISGLTVANGLCTGGGCGIANIGTLALEQRHDRPLDPAGEQRARRRRRR
jgi:hypothetical protein